MSTILTILKEIAPFLMLLPLYIYIRNEQNKDKKEHQDCISTINRDVAEHNIKIMQNHQNWESLGNAFNERMKHLENKVNQFENIVPEVQALKMKMELTTQKIDTLIESIKDQKSDNKETIREIKELLKSTK